MKKELHFDEIFDIGISMYILIENGKIRKYEGADFIPLMVYGKPQFEFKTFEIDSDFELIKLSKHERKKLNISANYRVECDYLFAKFIKHSYIKLNPFEKFKIDYSKKQTLFHKMIFIKDLMD